MKSELTLEDFRKASEILKRNAIKPKMVKCSCCDNLVPVYEFQAAPGVTQEQVDSLGKIYCEDHRKDSNEK